MRLKPSTRLPREWEEELSQRSLIESPRCHLSTCLVELAPARKGRPPKFCSGAHQKAAERNPELRVRDDEPVEWWGPGEGEWTGLMSEQPWDEMPDYGFGFSIQGRDLPALNDPVRSRANRWVPADPTEIIGQEDEI